MANTSANRVFHSAIIGQIGIFEIEPEIDSRQLGSHLHVTLVPVNFVGSNWNPEIHSDSHGLWVKLFLTSLISVIFIPEFNKTKRARVELNAR